MASDAVSRQDRDELRSAIEDFLAGRCDNLVYDDRIQAIAMRTADPTVDWVVSQLWYFYCDISTHRVRLGRAAWNLHQRLLLLLASGARVEMGTARSLHASQALAGAILLAIAAAWWWREPWTPLLHLPAAGAAWLLARWRSSAAERLLPPEPGTADATAPFPSAGAILRARRLVPDFRKAPHPAALAALDRPRPTGVLARLDRAGDRVLGCAWLGIGSCLAVVAAPLWLAAQCAPLRLRRWRIVVPPALDTDPTTGPDAATRMLGP